MKNVLITVVAVILSLTAGAFIGGKYVTKGEMLWVSCVLSPVSIK